MIRNLSLVLSCSILLGCNPLTTLAPAEPDAHYYRVGKTHRNVGPFVWKNQIAVDDPTGSSMLGYVYFTDPNLNTLRLTHQVVEVSRFVTSVLRDLGQDECPTESLLNVYFVPKETINDPEIMEFLTDPEATNHKTFYGLTTIIYPFPITASYICSDCDELGLDGLIAHELAHAWLALCGDNEFAWTEEIPEMIEADYFGRPL
jgi:hypothetical protein